MNIQMTVSLLATLVPCRWLLPDIVQTDFAPAIWPVAALHMFRFIGLTVLMPGQLDDEISQKAKEQKPTA